MTGRLDVSQAAQSRRRSPHTVARGHMGRPRQIHAAWEPRRLVDHSDHSTHRGGTGL